MSAAVLEVAEGAGGVSGGGEEDEISKERRRWVDCKADPQGQLFWEGGTVTNTLHLICKAAAKVHLSTASERPAEAPRQLMSPFQ